MSDEMGLYAICPFRLFDANNFVRAAVLSTENLERFFFSSILYTSIIRYIIRWPIILPRGMLVVIFIFIFMTFIGGLGQRTLPVPSAARIYTR